MKVCAKCRLDKPMCEFNKLTKSPDGHQQRCRSCAKMYNDEHAKEKSIKDRVRYADNKGHHAEHYRQHAVELSIYYAARYVNNKEKIDAYNKEWRVTHLEKRREYNRIYKALRLSVTIGVLPDNYWTLLVEEFGSICMHPDCARTDITLDHIIPLSKGGSHSMENFQLLCGSHNSSKGVKTIDYRQLVNSRCQ